jgi:HEAT repeat protein
MRRLRLELLAVGLCVLVCCNGGRAAGAEGPATGASAAPEQPPLFSGKPLSFWIRALNDRDPDKREHAVIALLKAGPRARDALPALAEAWICHEDLRDNIENVFLLDIDPAAKAIARVCLARLKDPNSHLRTYATVLLGKIADWQPDAVLYGLSEMLHDSNEEVRAAAMQGLSNLGPRALPAVPALIDGLHDESLMIRRAAANALAALGPTAKDAVIPLCCAMRDNPAVRGPAFAALLRFGEDLQPGVGILLDNLNREDEMVRLDSAIVLAQYKPQAKAAVAPLREILLHSAADPDRRLAAQILGSIGPDAKAAVPALLIAMKDKDASVRKLAHRALEDIDPETADHIPNAD